MIRVCPQPRWDHPPSPGHHWSPTPVTAIRSSPPRRPTQVKGGYDTLTDGLDIEKALMFACLQLPQPLMSGQPWGTIES